MAAPCHGKNIKQKKTITPIQMVTAAYNLFTLTPEKPRVVIVEKVTVNGRVTIRPVNGRVMIRPIQPIKKQ